MFVHSITFVLTNVCCLWLHTLQVIVMVTVSSRPIGEAACGGPLAVQSSLNVNGGRLWD